MPLLRTWRNCDDLRKTFRQFGLLNMLDQERWWTRQTTDPTVAMYGVLADDKLIGVCGLTGIHWTNRTAEISIYVGDPEYRKADVAVVVLRALAGIAFGEFNLHRLWAECYAFNDQMLKVLEMSGFTKEGTLVEHVFWAGKYWNSYIYGLIREEN